ncbi:Uncharacterised protein [Serratia fonticola]|uniref:Uncharacterized protein n=1 Tax=Serratia fonticola TaxID=47917 RepID=A0A4U9VC71_SERFO|nr:Uncharacterised protein [Serratia fonticola]
MPASFIRIGLWNGAWKPSSRKPLRQSSWVIRSFDQRNNQLIGHQLAAASMISFAFLPSSEPALTAARNISPVEICGMPVFLHDELSLSAFTSAWSAQQNDTHCVNPLAMYFPSFFGPRPEVYRVLSFY